MGSQACQGCLLNLPVDGSVDTYSRSSGVIHPLFIEDGTEIVGFKLFTDIVENYVQAVGDFSFFKRDGHFLCLQILVPGNKIKFEHIFKHIVLTLSGQFSGMVAFCFTLFDERIVPVGPFDRSCNKGSFHEIKIFRLFVKKTLGSNPQSFSVARYKELIDVHLEDFFFGIFSFQKKRLDKFPEFGSV